MHDLTETTPPKLGELSPPTATNLRKRILLVDDGVDSQIIMLMLLGEAEADIVVAENGLIAVDMATTHPFDLILMDMQMPVMDGYTATSELRHAGVRIPIIALTAHAMAEDREKCFACGCNGYLSKPVEEETLLKTVSQYLAKDLTTLPKDNLGIAGLQSLAGDADASTGSIVPNNRLDSNRIKSSHANNPRVMQIVPEFVASLPTKVHTMLHVVEGEDLIGLQRMAHQLVGTCGGYGFDEVTESARKVEQSIKAGRTLKSVMLEIDSLIGLIRRIDGYDKSKETAAVEEPVK